MEIKRALDGLGRPLQLIPEGSFKNRVRSVLFQSVGILPRGAYINRSDHAVMVGTPNVRRVHEFASLVGSSGRALFIEPEPENNQRLTEAADGYDHVTVDDRGAWSEHEFQELLLADSDHPADHKVPVDGVEHDNDYRHGSYADSVEIDVAPLDDIVSDYDLTPNYVEIMVNGAELEVLQGANEILNVAGPRLLVKGHARDEQTKDPIYEQAVEYIDGYGYESVVGGDTGKTVEQTDEWSRRAGDIYAWK